MRSFQAISLSFRVWMLKQEPLFYTILSVRFQAKRGVLKLAIPNRRKKWYHLVLFLGCNENIYPFILKCCWWLNFADLNFVTHELDCCYKCFTEFKKKLCIHFLCHQAITLCKYLTYDRYCTISMYNVKYNIDQFIQHT